MALLTRVSVACVALLMLAHPTSQQSPSLCPPAAQVGCLTILPSSPPSSSDAATEIAAEFANRAYNDTSAAKDAISVFGASDAHDLYDATTNTYGYVASGSDVVFVAFRGTDSLSNLNTDVASNLVSFQLGSGALVNVHSGFLTAMNAVYSDLVSAIQAFDPAGTKALLLTGHSLGAALANLAAASLTADPAVSSKVSAVYTFGSPRVGDSSWAAAYAALGLNDLTLRFVYYEDMVPMVPLTTAGYVHVGRMISLSADFSSCQESGADEYDVCQTDSSLLATLGTDFACATADVVLAPFVAAGCGGALLGAESSGASGVLPSIVQNVCTSLASGVLAGNPCCLLFEVVSSGQPIITTLSSYHSMEESYLPAVTNGCIGTCAMSQYNACGPVLSPSPVASPQSPTSSPTYSPSSLVALPPSPYSQISPSTVANSPPTPTAVLVTSISPPVRKPPAILAPPDRAPAPVNAAPITNVALVIATLTVAAAMCW